MIDVGGRGGRASRGGGALVLGRAAGLTHLGLVPTDSILRSISPSPPNTESRELRARR